MGNTTPSGAIKESNKAGGVCFMGSGDSNMAIGTLSLMITVRSEHVLSKASEAASVANEVSFETNETASVANAV